jgi:hypothetical protein
VNALVVVQSARIACANNVIRRESERPAALLAVGTGGAATVLGNITFGRIDLSPTGLGPPFAALNLVAP